MAGLLLLPAVGAPNRLEEAPPPRNVDRSK